MIDKCYILALDKRRSLWTSLVEECTSRGFDVKPFIVGDGSDQALAYDHIDIPGIPDSWQWGRGISAQRHYWAFASHKKIIKDALKKGYNNILLCEDDMYFCSRFDKHISEINNFYLKEDPDLLYLGSHFGDYENHKFSGNNILLEDEYKKTQKINFLPLHQCGGLFACIINKRIFPLILNMPPVSPIDSQLNQYKPLIKSYNVAPVVCYIKSCSSSCEGDVWFERDVL